MSASTQPSIALKALKRWVDVGDIGEATVLFRAVSKNGRMSAARLADGSIACFIKARCAAAGLDPREFAGHSLRASKVTSAAENCVAEWRIRLTSRHKSDILRQYIRPVEERRQRHRFVKDGTDHQA